MPFDEGSSPNKPEARVVALAPGRPVLDVPAERFAGYLLLESDERRFTAHAIQQHADFVDVWYRFLTLLKEGLLDRDFDLSESNLALSRQLALHLIAASGGTVKLILDAGLAGYYAQAFALIRHLFETWLRLEYIRLQPEQAQKWFAGDDGSAPRPPNEGTIHRYLRKHTEGGRKDTVIRILDEKLPFLNLMAHPSAATLQQTVGVSENRFEVGANYLPDHCVSVLHEGASGLRFILTALNDFFPQDACWYERLQKTIRRQSEVLDQVLRRKAERHGN